MTTLEKLLQCPDRADNMLGVEEHLTHTAALARAMYTMAMSETLNLDPRDAEALAELAGLVADHASAVRLAYAQEMETQ